MQRGSREEVVRRACPRGKVAVAAALAALSLACPKRTPPPAAPAPEHERTAAERAVSLYDQGQYDQAKAILETLEGQGQLSGPLMYRLGFCYGYAQNPQKQTEWMQRALTTLQQEAASSPSLEVSFFLSNAQANLGQTALAGQTAAEATARIENKTWPAPTRGLDKFRVGKLYADQARTQDAMRSYRSALEAFAAEGAPAPGYVRWARRYLGQEAFARADFVAAEQDYAAFVAAGGASPAEYDRLAVARVRLGKWSGAAEAWGEAVKLDPANADRPRYCQKLAMLAASLTSLPAQAPSGSAWSSLSKEDLENLLKEQAVIARQVQRETASGSPTDAQAREAQERKLAAAEPIFVAAALEYAVRNYDIRETAFLGGYAPLIFHAEEWHLPAAGGPEGEGKQDQN